ncbi:MAG: hypothetical protein JWN79_2316 [Gemmatimonadetes bacterium]|jgi:hypothetical protein|nr:hypothetical protein [Gemmatimonadota bacterium]
MRSTSLRLLALASLTAAWRPTPALAQGAAPTAPGASCEGLVVTRVDIQAARPPFEGSASRWRHAARAVGLHHATTRPGVIDAFSQLAVGERCTEQRRSETERLIRDQPFIANARVRALPDGQGGVAIVVETVDEVPVLVGGQLHGLGINSISLGNGNIGGNGLLGQGYFERGFGYRSGWGVRLIEYAAFGRPYVGTIEAFRHPLGFYRNVELAHPFYTDLQNVAWHLGYNDGEDYRHVARAARDPLALRVDQHRWDASTIIRAFGTRTVTLLGVGASGIRLTPDNRGVLVEDEGLRPDTGTTLNDRYQAFRAIRVGVLGGIRRVTFTPVRGFDGLAAQQDVATGIMTGLFAAHGIPSAGESDIFLSGGVYAGKGNEHMLLATVAQMEARRDQAANVWDSMVGSGRAAFYLTTAPGMLFVLDDRYSMGLDSRLPLQLDLGDRIGGILGYRTASIAGARRNAARAELRFSRQAMVRNADVGVAAFGESGTVWAGDVPYGRSATRATVGVSLLAAYPTRSKRLYRADIGIPLTPGGDGGGRIEVRFSSEDRTGLFWREPDDISRARTGPVASTLFVTPTTH